MVRMPQKAENAKKIFDCLKRIYTNVRGPGWLPLQINLRETCLPPPLTQMPLNHFIAACDWRLKFFTHLNIYANTP